ncbi:glycosyltransferase [Streptosporangiaceae bacterium NEAU-GS5]|nr:glycosyltransferase [Streptosporangiaceae bacterium NEAU-GS5]
MTDLAADIDIRATHGVASLNDAGDAPVLTVIVPTRNERENVPTLLEKLGAALAPLPAEILLVDDSDDDTPERLSEFAPDCHVPVRLLHRRPGSRDGGLGGAVVAGARHARGAWILVMDADLQHPPETAVMLARTAMRHDADIVIGTRYAGTGSVDGLDGATRLITASSAMRLAKTVFPRRLATVSDPMSGLFAFRREAIDLDRLNPIGFKILLELLVKHPSAKVAEVAYEMAPRHAGRSKASFRQGLTFMRHLTRLRRHRLGGQLRERPSTSRGRLHELGRLVAFGLVGLSGMVINTAALWLFYEPLGLHHLLGVALATLASTTWNFILTDTLIYRRSRTGAWTGRAARFFLVNILLLLPRLPAVEALVRAGIDVYVANVATLVVLFLARFLISDRVIYGAARTGGRDPVKVLVDLDAPEAAGPPSRKRYQYLPYRYDVAGIVRIGSQIMLPELEFFRAQWVADGDVDIAVRVGDVGRGPRRRASMTEYANQNVIRYEEHLGRLGANFRIELGETINIEVGPLLAASPHVVYTNIVEALLRFVMVSRDRMLLHSATVNLGGTGVMLSALTDTGKTATVLRLLRDHGGLFLSDDMTVIDTTGQAVCFPKPLTISAHTLRAVQANDLTPKEWRRLQFQSRLHSKGGRSIALRLAAFNLPIMGINAITQMIVPPPKYSVDRLVSCRIGSSVQVEELFIIERGAPRLSDLDRAGTLERMIQNTDDAYGFPPFRHLAPAITINGLGYQQLRDREREILAGFLSHVRTRVIASDKFGWADEIPALLNAENGRAGVPAVARESRLVADGWPRWAPSPSGGIA